MNLPVIIIIIIAIVLVVLSLKVIKGALKIAFSLFGIFFLVLILLLGMTYLDAKKMQGLLEEGNKTVLYQQGTTMVAGIHVGEGGFLVEGEGTLPENINVLGETELTAYETAVSEEEVGENELIFIVSDETFTNMSGFELNDVKITKDMFDTIMASDAAKEEAVALALEAADVSPEEKSAVEAGIEDQIGHFTDEELKSALFLVAFSTYVEEEGERALLEEVKEENIVILPRFLIMNVIKYMPDTVFERLMDRASMLGAEQEEVET